ncbi:MAG: SAF domain-containing protein [Planctomycetota bacterium]
MVAETPSTRPARHRPRTTTVFVAAFVAGAAAAVGVNRALDVHLAQAKPQVECEPIFVALRALPQGAPLTVWDVALRDLPKAMVPATALRVTDSFEGRILKFPLREGQPLVSGQLVQPEPAAPAAAEAPAPENPAREELVEEAFVAPVPAAPSVATRSPEPVGEASDLAAGEPAETSSQPTATLANDTAVEPTPAVVEPTPTAVAQPTPAATLPESDQPQVDRQASIAAPAKLQVSTVDQRSTADDTLDVPSRPPVDVSSLPSVMAREAAAATPAEGSEASPGVRYLVVPERIARQADTSFTIPTAPSAGPMDPDARGAAPMPLASGAQPASTPPVRQPKAQSPMSQSRQAQAGPDQAGQTDARQPQQSQTRTTQQAPSRQQAQPQTRSRQAGGRSSAQREPAELPAAEGRQAPGPRAWGGMFPNVSAGLEAMGGWRSGRTNSDQSAPGSTTR